jgi:hypothetical protein
MKHVFLITICFVNYYFFYIFKELKKKKKTAVTSIKTIGPPSPPHLYLLWLPLMGVGEIQFQVKKVFAF